VWAYRTHEFGDSILLEKAGVSLLNAS
jgi:hypothetical protein